MLRSAIPRGPLLKFSLSSNLRSISTSTFVPPAPSHGLTPPHLLTLADLTVPQIQSLITSAIEFKAHYKASAIPPHGRITELPSAIVDKSEQTLAGKTVALIFSKRSTRTRVASETSIKLLGGHPMFLGSADIQLGVNESLYDTSRVVSSMVDGIMARVGHHSEVETLAANSTVPVINALSHLYHPTQILADIQTLLEVLPSSSPSTSINPSLNRLSGLKIAWIGDSNNILNEMMVTYPRLGVELRIATPKGYDLDSEILGRANELVRSEGGTGRIVYTNDPVEAVTGADVVTTDTWISMGQEEETARRLKDFSQYQITDSLLTHASPKCIFMHCLPRHEYEVDDHVFYGDKSVVFQEAENRKWTILACFDAFVGRWKV